MTSTSPPRRSSAVPRFAGLVGALALHSALYAAAAVSIISVGPLDPADGGGAPLVVAWAPRPTASDDVVALQPAVDEAKAAPPQAEPPIEDVAVVDAPIVASPAPPDAMTTSDCRPSPPDYLRAHAPLLAPRRGGGGGNGLASSVAGVGCRGGAGGGTGAGGGSGGSGVGSTAGDGDGGEAPGPHGGGATRGPSIVGTLSAPAYPSKARSRGWEGRVVLRLSIDENGRVVAVDVEESSGRAALDEAACDAAREWSFAPALRDDSPVAGTLRVPVRFELSD